MNGYLISLRSLVNSKTKHFHDFIYLNLKQHTGKEVISNAESRSSWRFLRFNSLNLEILSTSWRKGRK